MFTSCAGKKRHSINEWIFSKTKFVGANVKIKLDLSNYPTQTDLKNATGVDRSDFAKKTDLANLKPDVDKLDIKKFKNVPSNLSNLKSKVVKLDVDELVPVPVDLTKLSDVVRNDVVNPIQDGGATNFSPVPSPNVSYNRPQNFLTFSFNSFATLV